MRMGWIGAGAVALLLAALVVGSRQGDAGPTAALKTAVFAGGCFWCMEAAFDEVDGVTETTSGYAGGTAPDPTYGQHEGYQEAVRVTYDPAKVGYAKLLDQYWHNIDPFDSAGQFCDKGEAYRSVVFYGDEAEKGLADQTKQEIAGRFRQPVATEIRPLTTFTAAEWYHQDFHIKNAVKYNYYKTGCGRPQRLEEIWGPPPS